MKSNIDGLLSYSDKDFFEDYKYDNGCYTNKCIRCKEWFGGHKRRRV